MYIFEKYQHKKEYSQHKVQGSMQKKKPNRSKIIISRIEENNFVKQLIIDHIVCAKNV